MKFFISGETDVGVGDTFPHAMRRLNRRLNDALGKKDYGKADIRLSLSQPR